MQIMNMRVICGEGAGSGPLGNHLTIEIMIFGDSYPTVSAFP